MTNNDNIDMNNKKFKGFSNWIIVVAIITIISTPLFLEIVIFRSNIASKISNGEWASFFGSFLGGIIGAVIAGIVTIYGIKLTIQHNTRVVLAERKMQLEIEHDKEIKSNMPFMHISCQSRGGGNHNAYFLHNLQHSIQHTFVIANFGMNAALEMKCIVDYNDSHNNEICKRDLFVSKRSLLKDETYRFKLGIPRENNISMITICFQDLLGNNYEQEIFFKKNNEGIECINHKPLIRRDDGSYVR